MAKKSSGGTPATVALTKAGVAFTVHPYAHSEGVTSFGEEAAAALGVDPERIFKTLVVDAGGELVVAVLPVARQLDLKALAGAAGAKKAVMAEPAAAARSSGYVVGGISPLGQRTQLRTFVDRSAEDFPTIFVSAGKRGLQVELAASDLLRITGGQLSSLAARRDSAPTIEEIRNREGIGFPLTNDEIEASDRWPGQ